MRQILKYILLILFLGFVYLSWEDVDDLAKPLAEAELRVGAKVKKVERLGGLANKNYLVHFENGEKRVIKLFRQIGQREQERNNQNQAWRLHLAPKMELINDQMALVDYVSDSGEIDIDEQSLSLCGELIAKLHSSELKFDRQFDFCQIQMIRIQNEKNITSAEREFVLQAIEEFRSLAPALSSLSLAPSHNDLHKANILIGKAGAQLIDWEDSAMNDPAWDIAYFLVSCHVSEELWSHFLKTYLRSIPAEDTKFIQRVKLYRPFVLIDIALSLKILNIEEVNHLVNFCMDTAREILSDEGYIQFLSSFKSKE